MQLEQFDMVLRSELSNEIARMMGLDGQDAHRDAKRDKVVGIELRYIDEHEHETEITEFTGDELNGPNAGIDSIVGMIESATMRDAQTRYGNALYAIFFHLSGNQKNRGRFPFRVPGGAHMYRGSGGGSSSALAAYGRGGGMQSVRGMMGEVPLESGQIADVFRVAVEFLKYTTEERKQNDDRTQILVRGFESLVKQQQEVIESRGTRDLSVIELQNEMFTAKYEIDKKREDDAERKKWAAKAIEAVEAYGPLLLPPVIETIRKFNNGPNYVPSEMDMEKLQNLIRKAKGEAVEEPTNGHAGGQNGHVPGPPPPQGTQQPGDPSPIDIFHHRIAFDVCRLIGMVKANGHIDSMRAAFDPGSPALMAFDAIVAAVGQPGVGSTEESVNELAQLTLMFGGALQSKPEVGLKILQSVSGFERAGLIELSQLLKQYVEFVQQAAASEQQQQPAASP